MIQDYQTINSIISESRPILRPGSQIQKIFSTSRYIALSMRTPGKTFWVYLGRGGGFEGIWLAQNPPVSELRKRDQLLEYLRKHLSSATFLELKLDQSDRIIELKYGKWGKENSFYYFYKGREAYFAHHFFDGETWRTYTSAHGHLKEKSLDSYFNDLGRADMSKDSTGKKVKEIDQLLEDEFKLLDKAGGKDQKFLKRKLKNIKGDLDKIQQWPKLQKYADEIQKRAFEHADSFDDLKGKMKILQHKFNFIGSKHVHEKLNIIYEKIKKLKKAEDLVKARLAETKQKGAKKKIESHLKVIQPIWQQSKKKASLSREKKQEYKIFQFPMFTVAVGRSAQENDEIRRDWAKKTDWWFHIEHIPSAHLYVKKKAEFVWTPDLLAVLASCLKDHSKYQATEIPLLYTEVKNLKGIKGKAGAVIFKKEKRMNIIYDENWERHVQS